MFNLTALLLSNLLVSHVITHASAAIPFNQLIAKFQKSPLVEIEMSKTVKLEIQGNEKSYAGKIFLSKGLFRLETEDPEKTLLVFDGKFVWNVQYPSPDFPGAIQVTQAKLDKKNRQQILLVTLLKDPISQNFSVVEESPELVKLKPKKDLSIKDLQVKMDSKAGKISSVSYLDDLGNQTTIIFKSTKFLKSIKPGLFKYKPESGAEVSKM